MHRRISWPILGAFVAALLVFAGISAPTAWGQGGTTGTVAVTVLDQSGGIVAGAQLELQDVSTNDIRNAVTQDRGTYTFVGLAIGTYKLTISKTGFETQLHDSVIVQAAQVTDVNVALKVAAATGEKVEVTESSTPLVDTTSNAIGTTIDMKQIEDLPLGGRDLGVLSTLVPGTANSSAGPTWNGLPVMAQGGNIDGVVGSTNRMKFAGNGAEPDVSPRIEDISEMTVQTDQLDLNQGFGQSTMQLNFVTRRGTNSFHGRVFEDFQNSYLNANSWTNDARNFQTVESGGTASPKPHYELNDFGGSVGGPILKNKLFFFGTYAESKQPGLSVFSNSVLTPAAQAGVFAYPAGSVCLFTNSSCANGLVNQYNAAHGTNFPTSINPTVGVEQGNINSILSLGQVTGTTDPNVNSLAWQSPNPTTQYYPTARVDYNVSQSLRVNFAWNMTKTNQPNAIAPQFPGALYAPQGTGSAFKDYTAALGIDWTIRPTLVNELRGGYLYHYDGFGAVNFGNIENQYPSVNWAVGSSGQGYGLPTPDYYPVFNFADTMTWQHGAHTVNYGLTWYREQDHYWNAPAGWATYSLGLGAGDPALNMFTSTSVPGANGRNLGEIEGLYATLAGRISNVNVQNAYNAKTGTYYSGCQPCAAYDLDERSQAWGLFFQDSYRVKTNLTLNYGLRWDFTGANTDLTNAYTSVPGPQLYGPSGPGNLFNAGSLLGTMNPQYVANGQPYHPWKVAPQPTIGIAWSPQYSEGFLGKLLGGGQTVIRSGFSLRNFVQPYQYMWNYATDTGSFYYQSGQLNPGPVGTTGFFQAGTLALAGGSPNGEGNGQLTTINQTTPLAYNPPTFTRNVPMSTYTFLNFNPDFPNSAWGFDPNIKQPYTESWNLGIQRQLGNGNALEIRYIGNRSIHQWMGVDTNEVNILQNNMPGGSFLNQFQQAQTNLALNNVSANAATYPNYAGTFAYNPAVVGERDTPVFDAAFAGETGALSGTDFGDQQFITWLGQGAAGAFAQALTQPSGGQAGANFFCNLVGASFSPCATNVGFTGAGAGYPINYFQANPFETGGGTELMTSGGYSNYNGLQFDFRQKQWHGMQFDANYTWAHTLGLVTSNDWLGQLDNIYTLRNLRLNYGPTLYDIRNSVNISGTYDLPFGKGKRYLASNGLLDRVVGGWTVGTIFTWHSGNPFTLSGGYQTFNATYLGTAGGGVVLNGISVGQLQNAVGVFEQNPASCSQAQNLSCPVVATINPQLLASATGGVIPGTLTPNSSAGTITAPIWLHGPHFINDDLAVTKSVPIRENLRFSLQAELLNAFNHPNFGTPDAGVQDTGFGSVFGPVSSSRAIELRANLEF